MPKRSEPGIPDVSWTREDTAHLGTILCELFDRTLLLICAFAAAKYLGWLA